LLAQPTYAQQAPTVSSNIAVDAFVGPPVSMISRQVAGPPTLRAVQLLEPLRIDGRLDEALYTNVPAISDFVQMEPEEGAPATERTELWIAFDRDTFYVSFRCWESQPERVVAKEMRRDHGTIWSGDDNVSFFLDTFYDRRNGFTFTVNSLGGRQDARRSTSCSGTATGTRSGMFGPGGSKADGSSKRPFRSSRCATALGKIRSGGSTPIGRTDGRTSCHS
jgi:hypothetical protein